MDLFFYFKRLVGLTVQPLVLAYLFLALALLLYLFTSRRKMAGAAVVLSFLVLIASSTPLLTRNLANSLEKTYQPFLGYEDDGYRPHAIVVLGNGVAHPGDVAMPALSRLNDTARARLVEGVRLALLFPEATLVVSGYGMGLENCADAMAVAAMELGVEPERVTRLAGSIDTENEAQLVRDLAGDQPVLVVTSAIHMPRAMSYFAESGVRALAAPCDFIAPASDPVLETVNRWYWRPKGKNISDSEATWHELMGLAYRTWLRRPAGGD